MAIVLFKKMTQNIVPRVQENSIKKKALTGRQHPQNSQTWTQSKIFGMNWRSVTSKPTSKEEVISGIRAFWETVTTEKCQKYIGCLKKVIPEVIACEGGATAYWHCNIHFTALCVHLYTYWLLSYNLYLYSVIVCCAMLLLIPILFLSNELVTFPRLWVSPNWLRPCIPAWFI